MFESLRKILAPGFAVPSGTSSQFLKADGSTDATTYTVNSEVTRASIRPSLLLDFANSKTLDPRITFTRNSTASYYGKDGLLKTAAINSPRFDHNPTTGESLGLLIEEQRTNLLTYSEQFDNAAWGKTNITITSNTTISPDGNSTADKLVENTANTTHLVSQTCVGAASTPFTISIYVAEAGRSKFDFLLYDGTSYIGRSIDLSTAQSTITQTGVADAGSGNTTITKVNNGFYRVSITNQSPASTTTRAIDIRLSNGSSVSYTGDGTSGIYIWGAQLEQGAFPTSYIPSTDTFTSRATTGTYIGSNGLIQTAAINTARLNYNPLNLALSPKLLLESASTNLLTYSEQFDNAAWLNADTTVTANTTLAPDGTNTADSLIEAVTTTTHTVRQQITGTSGIPYTFSVHLKANTRTQASVELYTAATIFRVVVNLTNGAFIASTGTGTYNVTALTNGWYRISVMGISTNAAINGFVGIASGGAISYAGDGTSGIYIWGAQLEANSYVTSYIPTTTAQVTRAADVSSSAQSTRIADSATMTGTNFSSWYRQDEGTVFVKYTYENPTNSTGAYACTISINDGTMNNGIYQLTQSSSNLETFGVRSNSVVVADMYSSQAISTTSSNIAAGVYQSNSFAACLNGLSLQTDSSGNVPVNVNQMNIGNRLGYIRLNGRIAKLAYYPKRLTNAELQAITTP